ncbi:MAG: ABC transporter ATP-binding protein [Azoarcus sp.]|jgi:ABC-2 type transport system ATP-binding protein|nr:ABC transporter ATP-binding protein [Azoarcus sp.]
MAVPAIRVTAVTKRYGDLLALAGVDLEIGQGEFFGLLGPNGAGKTTLISALAGLIRADGGTLEIMGHDVVSASRDARLKLGVVPQELVFDPFFTVREMLTFQSGYFGIRGNGDWIDEILHGLGLSSRANANMRALSGGMKRRVLVAQALAHRPPVIVLDEPTAGVDVELRQNLWQFVKKLNTDGHTVVLTTHYLEEAEALCGRIAMMKAGRIVALDTTANLLSRFTARAFRVRAGHPAAALGLGGAAAGNDWVEFGFDAPADIESLLARLREAGADVREIAVGGPDLEQVFVEVMRHA